MRALRYRRHRRGGGQVRHLAAQGRPRGGALRGLRRRAGRPVRDESAWLLGAARVIAVDQVEYRLEFARRWAGVETVFPPKGLSGVIRRTAYRLPETHARHWMTLLLADRVELWEHRIARLVKLVAVVPMGIADVLLAARVIRSRS